MEEKNITRKNLVFLIIGILIGIAIVASTRTFRDAQAKENLADEYDYNVSLYTKISDKDIYNEQNEFSGLVYIGKKSSEGCQMMVSVLNEILNEDDRKYVNYFDTQEYKQSQIYHEILSKYEIDEVPEFIFIKKDGGFEKYDKDKGYFFQWIYDKLEIKESNRNFLK